MKIYWTFNQIPELRDLPCDQRYRVWRASCDTPKFRGINAFAVVTVMVPVVWLISQAKMPTWTAAVLAGMSAGIISFIVEQVQFERIRPSVREYLKEEKLRIERLLP